MRPHLLIKTPHGVSYAFAFATWLRVVKFHSVLKWEKEEIEKKSFTVKKFTSKSPKLNKMRQRNLNDFNHVYSNENLHLIKDILIQINV